MFTIIIKFIHRLIEIKEESEALSTVFTNIIKHFNPQLDNSKISGPASIVSGAISGLALLSSVAAIYIENQDLIDEIGVKVLGFCGWKSQD